MLDFTNLSYTLNNADPIQDEDPNSPSEMQRDPETSHLFLGQFNKTILSDRSNTPKSKRSQDNIINENMKSGSMIDMDYMML